MVPLLAEEIGWHLGDGSMNWYNDKGFYQLRGHLIDDRAHYEKVIFPAYKRLFGMRVHLREMPSTGVFGFQVWSDELVRYKQSIGLPVGPKLDCAIPAGIMEHSGLCIAMVRGIFDTDGMLFLENKRGKPYPRIEIKQTSRVLAQQIHKILEDQGFRVTTYQDNRGEGKWRPLLVTSVRGREMLERWMKIIKPHNPKHIQKHKQYHSWQRQLNWKNSLQSLR
jgi:hypothetical protein